MKTLSKLTCSAMLSLGLLGCVESENEEKTTTEFFVTAPANQEVLEQTLGALSAEISSNSSAELSTSWSIQSAPSGFAMNLIGGELDSGQSRVEFETPDVSEDTNLVLRLHYSVPESENYLAQADFHDVALTIKANKLVDLSLPNIYYFNDMVHFLYEGGVGEVVDKDEIKTELTWTSSDSSITINYSGQGLTQETSDNYVQVLKSSDWLLLDEGTFNFQIISAVASYNGSGEELAEYTETSEVTISKAIDFDLLPQEQTFSELALILPYQQDVWTGEPRFYSVVNDLKYSFSSNGTGSVRFPVGPLQGDDQRYQFSWQLVNSPFPALELYFEPSETFSEGLSLTYWQFEFYSKQRPSGVAVKVGDDVNVSKGLRIDPNNLPELSTADLVGVESAFDEESLQYWSEYFDDGRLYTIRPSYSDWENEWDYTVQEGRWTFENNILEVQTDGVIGWSEGDQPIELFNCPSDGPDFTQGCERWHTKAELVGQENGQPLFYKDGSLWADGDAFIMRQQQYWQPKFEQTPPSSMIASLIEQLNLANLGRDEDSLPDTASEPQQTTAIDMSLNLNSNEAVLNPTRFDPMDTSTYTSATSIVVYDSLGYSKIVSVYFVKTNNPAIVDVNAMLDASSATDGFVGGLAAVPPAQQGNANSWVLFATITDEQGSTLPVDLHQDTEVGANGIGFETVTGQRGMLLQFDSAGAAVATTFPNPVTERLGQTAEPTTIVPVPVAPFDGANAINNGADADQLINVNLSDLSQFASAFEVASISQNGKAAGH